MTDEATRSEMAQALAKAEAYRDYGKPVERDRTMNAIVEAAGIAP